MPQVQIGTEEMSVFWEFHNQIEVECHNKESQKESLTFTWKPHLQSPDEELEYWLEGVPISLGASEKKKRIRVLW